MKTIHTSTLLVSLVTIALGGCVSQGKYDAAVAQTETTRAELSKKAAALGEAQTQLTQREQEAARLAALIDQLSSTSSKERASSEARVTELRKRLDELRLAQAAAESRAAVFRDVAKRLQQQIDSGELQVITRDGRMVLVLPNDVLFDTGKTDIKPAGKAALAAIADVLKTMPNRQFQIAGHTDNVPIHNAEFASNWELSSGRALGVVHFLLGKGVPPGMLSAAGYGEVDPVAPNADAANRKRNRRTEITLQPEIGELVHVP